MQGRPHRPIRIAVIGARQTSAHLAEVAEAIGREVARRGGVLLCGGMTGVMEAAARGAAAAGGPYLTIPLPTGMGEARNVILVRSAEAIIAVGGAYGTLSEIGHALNLGVPVIGLETWNVSREGVTEPDPVRRAKDALEAVEWAWVAAVERRRRSR